MICYAESLTFSSTLVWFLILCCVRDHVKSHGDLVKSSRDTDITMRGRYPDKLEELARTATNQYAFMSPFFSRQGISSSQMNVALVNFQLGKLGLNSTTNPEMASAMLNVTNLAAKRRHRRSKLSSSASITLSASISSLTSSSSSSSISSSSSTSSSTSTTTTTVSEIILRQRTFDNKLCRSLLAKRYYQGRTPVFSTSGGTQKQSLRRDRYEIRMHRCTELKAKRRERRRERRRNRRRNRRERRMRERRERKEKKRRMKEQVMLAKNNVLRKKRQRKLRKKLRKGIKRAFRNLKIARKTNVCRKPVKVVVCVDDLLMNTNSIEIDILNNTKTYTAANAKELSLEMYQPRCLLVKRCSNTTGCCDSNSACVPKTVVTKKKSFFKFQRTDKSPLLMFEKTVVISYEEHKQCKCKQIKTPTKYGCIKCEQPFFPTMTDSGICYCGCQNSNLKCKAILSGNRRLPPKYLNCLRNGHCNDPLCDYGFNHHWKSLGYCPKSFPLTTPSTQPN